MKKKEFEPGVWVVWKESGMTMGQLVSVFRMEMGFPQERSITFTGRLDPLVTGLVVLLVGDKVHEKEKWTRLDKTYKAEILLGISTDTYDIFGIIENQKSVEMVDVENVHKVLSGMSGTSFEYPYPPFSSKTVRGKPLWLSSRAGEVVADRPKGVFRVHEVVAGSAFDADLAQIKEKVAMLTKVVIDDFRQSEILNSWEGVSDQKMYILRAEFSVGSGTYVRSLAHMIEEKTSVPACIFSLERTKVGLICKTFLDK